MAGSNVGWSTLDVIPSVKNLAGELDKQTRGQFATAGKRGGQQFGDAAGKEAAGRIKTRLGGAFREALAPAAGLLAGAGIVQGLRSVLDAASDAQQSVGGVQAVFKQYADEVIKDSQRAEQGLGLSTTAYQELVTISGALLKNKGLSDFADQAENLLQIGADLAAQYGGSTKDAVEALNAALRGESDPIERYAISLNETAVNAVLAANGQSKLTGAALEQAKTQARLAIITQQSADAAGAFARESDTQAGAAARTSAQWANMRAELGEKLLPAEQAFTSFLNNQGLPALEATGGAVADAIRFFDGLPAPVRAATGALVAFKIAQATGVTGQVASGFNNLSAALGQIQTRASNATAVYKNFRSELFVAGQAGTSFSGTGTRIAATMEAIRAASIGAGAGIRRGLSGALNLVGGPWGAAFIAGTAVVAHFWQEHQKAEARVKEFTATLDAETGALTKSSEEFVRRQLLESGALKAAKDLGLSLSLVTDAALGNESAISAVNAQLQAFLPAQQSAQANGRAFASGLGEQGTAAHRVADAIGGMNGIISQSANDASLLAAAHGQTTSATEKTTTATRNYATELDQARSAVQKLLDKENERRNKNLGAFQDQTRLAQALADARKEAQDGARTLDKSTEAGRKNRDALAGLADAWNSAADKVKNAKGAYADMRQNFIDVAEKMGASETQAKKLADRLLGIPKKTPAQVTTPGMDAALDKVRELNRLLRLSQGLRRIVITAQAGKNQAAVLDAQAHAGGGLLRGPGTGTSDSILTWGSNGEFMQRKRAVDYYGVDFMRRLNNLQVPRFAGGGPVGSVAQSSATGGEFRGVLSIDRDGIAYIRGVVREEINAVERARVNAQRLAGMGGTPR